jgi:hypothetical protein
MQIKFKEMFDNIDPDELRAINVLKFRKSDCKIIGFRNILDENIKKDDVNFLKAQICKWFERSSEVRKKAYAAKNEKMSAITCLDLSDIKEENLFIASNGNIYDFK